MKKKPYYCTDFRKVRRHKPCQQLAAMVAAVLMLRDMERKENMNLESIVVKIKNGDENFYKENNYETFQLKEFWGWAFSDLLNNTLRGVLAEFIVAQDLGITKKARVEWDAYDLETEEGIKIEVKSTSFLQSWHQNDLSVAEFSIKQTKGWDSKTNEYSIDSKRQADVYVFCLLNHEDKNTVDPLNLNQWEFYIISREELDLKKKNQKSIRLTSLKKLNPIKATYGEIKNAIYEIIKK